MDNHLNHMDNQEENEKKNVYFQTHRSFYILFII